MEALNPDQGFIRNRKSKIVIRKYNGMVIFILNQTNANKMNIKLIIGIAAAAGLAYFFTTKQGKNLLNEVGIDVDDLYSQGEEVIKKATKRVTQKGQDISNNIHQPFNA